MRTLTKTNVAKMERITAADLASQLGFLTWSLSTQSGMFEYSSMQPSTASSSFLRFFSRLSYSSTAKKDKIMHDTLRPDSMKRVTAGSHFRARWFRHLITMSMMKAVGIPTTHTQTMARIYAVSRSEEGSFRSSISILYIIEMASFIDSREQLQVMTGRV